MRATSLHQPYASLVACGLKGVETRGPRSPRAYRGPLLIHATKAGADGDAYLGLRRSFPEAFGKLHERHAGLPNGAIVAVVRVADIRLMTPEWIAEQTPLERAVGGWEPGRYGWVLEDVRALPKPIPFRGRQGLFEVDVAALLTKKQREELEHALGLDYPHHVKRGVTWRDHFCTNDGNEDMEQLVALGLMRRGHAINEGRDRYYHATEAGMALVGIKRVTS